MTPLLSSTLLRTQSDARLAEMASHGSDRAFEAIVERYRRPLHRFCRSVLPEARAEDAVQTTFLKAWAAMSEGTEVADLRPWLYRIARNSALDNARKAGYAYEELTDALLVAPGPEAEVERRRVIRETLTGVAGLPEPQREALLRTAAGHSRNEIAHELALSEGAVRQLVHRARTTLRAAATALTPIPLLSWAALGESAAGPATQRIAELAAGAGSAGIASAALKAGTIVVAAGVLAAGPGSELGHKVAKSSSASAAEERTAGHRAKPAPTDDRGGLVRRGRDGAEANHRRGRGHGRAQAQEDGSGHRGSGSSGGGEDRSGSSGSSGSDDSGSSGSDGGDDHPGSSESGSGSGSSGSGESGSGSSGSGESGSGESGSGSSGSGDSGSGGSDGGASGSDSGDALSGSGHISDDG